LRTGIGVQHGLREQSASVSVATGTVRPTV
jgi:hypothetical protein